MKTESITEPLAVVALLGIVLGILCAVAAGNIANEKKKAAVAALATSSLENARLAKELRECNVKRDYAENEMKYMDPECAGFACAGLFNSETAGVIATVQLDYEVSIYDWQHFCMTDVRVDMWKHYAGATLIEFGIVPTAVPGQYVMHCGWLVPSKVWCKK